MEDLWFKFSYIHIARSIQGWIQCSSSYANDEVVFPPYGMLNRLKNV